MLEPCFAWSLPCWSYAPCRVGRNAQQTFQVAPEEEKKPLVTPPKLVRFVEADYPETEGEEPVEASVELDIVVGKDGLVTEVSVARSAGEAF